MDSHWSNFRSAMFNFFKILGYVSKIVKIPTFKRSWLYFFKHSCENIAQMSDPFYSYVGGTYGDARMTNWPHRHPTPWPEIASHGLRRNHGGGEHFETGNLFAPISSLLTEVCE